MREREGQCKIMFAENASVGIFAFSFFILYKKYLWQHLTESLVNPSKYSNAEVTLNKYLIEIHDDSSDLDRVLECVITSCSRVLNCEKAFVMLLNEHKTKFIVSDLLDYLSETENFRRLKQSEINLEIDIAGTVISTEKISNMKYGDESQSTVGVELNLESGYTVAIRSCLCVPIIIRNEVIGVIKAVNKLSPDNFFSDLDEKHLEIISAHSGLALRKAKLYMDEVRAHRESSAVLSIVRARSTECTIGEVLETATAAAYELLLPEKVSIYLCDHQKREAWICLSKDAIHGLTIPFGQGVAGTVAATGKNIRVANAYEDSRFFRDIDQKTGFQTRSILCVAVPGFGAQSNPIAVIQLMNKQNGRDFDEDDEAALTALSIEVSLALRGKMLEIGLLKTAQNSCSLPQDRSAALEASLLKEYSTVAQRCRYFSVNGSSPLYTSPQTLANFRSNSCTKWMLASPDLIGVQRRHSIEGIESSIVNDWDVNPFSISNIQLLRGVEQMFEGLCLFDTFEIPVTKLRRFIVEIRDTYHSSNSFHNFQHGWSVTQMTYKLLRSGADAFLTQLEIFVLLVAALSHDADHPGNNNAFEIAARTEIALTYADESVLERHHIAVTMRLLENETCNILCNLEPEQQLEARALLRHCILATDMTHHFDNVNDLNLASTRTPVIDKNSPVARRQLMAAVIHSADLSGQVMRLDLAKLWGDRLVQEFRLQAEKETKQGLLVTPYMQDLGSELAVMHLQQGFVANIVLPLWTAMAACFPQVQHLRVRAEANLAHYKDRIIMLS